MYPQGLAGISPVLSYAMILGFPSVFPALGMTLCVDLHDLGKVSVTIGKLLLELVKSVSLLHQIRLPERKKNKGFQGDKCSF